VVTGVPKMAESVGDVMMGDPLGVLHGSVDGEPKSCLGSWVWIGCKRTGGVGSAAGRSVGGPGATICC